MILCHRFSGSPGRERHPLTGGQIARLDLVPDHHEQLLIQRHARGGVESGLSSGQFDHSMSFGVPIGFVLL